MTTLLVLKRLLSLHNKTGKVAGLWRMKRAEVLEVIRKHGYTVVETGANVELRPLGGRTHVRKKVLKTRK